MQRGQLVHVNDLAGLDPPRDVFEQPGQARVKVRPIRRQARVRGRNVDAWYVLNRRSCGLRIGAVIRPRRRQRRQNRSYRGVPSRAPYFIRRTQRRKKSGNRQKLLYLAVGWAPPTEREPTAGAHPTWVSFHAPVALPRCPPARGLLHSSRSAYLSRQ